jgi:hypothetical protein
MPRPIVMGFRTLLAPAFLDQQAPTLDITRAQASRRIKATTKVSTRFTKVDEIA